MRKNSPLNQRTKSNTWAFINMHMNKFKLKITGVWLLKSLVLEQLFSKRNQGKWFDWCWNGAKLFLTRSFTCRRIYGVPDPASRDLDRVALPTNFNTKPSHIWPCHPVLISSFPSAHVCHLSAVPSSIQMANPPGLWLWLVRYTYSSRQKPWQSLKALPNVLRNDAVVDKAVELNRSAGSTSTISETGV